MDSLESLTEEIVACRRCPRLVEWREKVAREKRRAYRDWDYWGRPVPGFGDPAARLLIVGLAPAAHGGNRTGRVFTGDRSGDFLFGCLYRQGFCSQPVSERREDGLTLRDCYIAATVRCAPPDNKPARNEEANCFPYLVREFLLLPEVRVLLALGKIAFDALLSLARSEGIEWQDKPVFAHGAACRAACRPLTLYASYHPSQQNTQTGRLTEAMFLDVLERIGNAE
ncbi:MAG: uracil-DNA glycosylase [Armatimonadetes bacterium]|nr:uracil-DNA glycosylase [Armatimonadota bacterium]